MDDVASLYGAHVRSKAVVTPHATYRDYYLERSVHVPHTDLRSYYGFDRSQFVFLFLGMLRRYKGLDDLILAFSQVENPLARLLVAGSPFPEAYREELTDLCKVDARILLRASYIPDEEIKDHMELADVVVLPFDKTLSSGSTMLALGFGRPLILPSSATRLGVPGQNGALYYSNIRELVSCLQTACGSDLTKMGQYNMRLAREFSWDAMARATASAYRRTGLCRNIAH